ncbi:hypothetical protein Q8A67_020498 [Cirrhinus molitorella]|uniref:Uncharacterized protein n=1 Tax=Cirrhinus molitorella TaxID=172907 RepID=A0AA88P7V2_9TELE|nr:hypothetical protein Q8A67_020498 [Cirrhinus molitorella]
MHSGSFGYNYNGIDLSVNRPNNGHFGAVGDNSRAFQNPGQETRYRQSSCSLSSPDPLSCATSESLELKGSSPPSDQSTPTGNSRLTNSNNLTSNNSTHFADTDETNVSSETEEGAQTTTTTRTQKQESVASSTTTPNDGQTPQIFPWMRKLHISHEVFSVLLNNKCIPMRLYSTCDPLRTHFPRFIHQTDSLQRMRRRNMTRNRSSSSGPPEPYCHMTREARVLLNPQKGPT